MPIPHSSQDTSFVYELLADSAQRVFAEQCSRQVAMDAEAGTWPEALWRTLEENGFTRAAVAEEHGGAGLSIGDALALARIAACYAAPVPLGETIMAAWLLALGGLPVPNGPLAFAPVARRSRAVLSRSGTGWRLDASLPAIPWGNRVTRVVLVVDTADGPRVVNVDPAAAQQTPGTNLAGEPRVRLDFVDCALDSAEVAPAPVDATTPYHYGALLRCQQMAGALEAARDLAVRYTSERIAFGKPLNRLQAVQQNLAILAAETAAARVAADMALAALHNPAADLLSSMGLAKVRVNEAAGIGARLAHQVHGAIGFTDEHRLQLFTRRLWSWRDEFGNDAWWAEQVGQRIIAAGADGLWNHITRIAQL